MATVNGRYDLHLWPSRDAIHYAPSDLHRHCQNLHVATAVTLGFALLLTALQVSSRNAMPTTVAGRFRVASEVTILVAGALYLASLSTLAALVSNLEKDVDRVPIPLPDVGVRAASGAYLDASGFFAATVGSVVSLYGLITSGRDGYQQVA